MHLNDAAYVRDTAGAVKCRFRARLPGRSAPSIGRTIDLGLRRRTIPCACLLEPASHRMAITSEYSP